MSGARTCSIWMSVKEAFAAATGGEPHEKGAGGAIVAALGALSAAGFSRSPCGTIAGLRVH
eukprot:832802-Prorocentrum_minimum.AAC.1